jgi:hypothetical protein
MGKLSISAFIIGLAAISISTPVLGIPPFNNDNEPDWESTDERGTYEVALADFNGDGWQTVTGEVKTGDGHARVFYVNHFPALTINAVSVNGTPVPRSDYCFDAQAGWFSLKNSPADGAFVEVDYVWSDKLDLFATNYPRTGTDGREVIYFNTGDGLNPEPGWISGIDDDNWVCEAADYDNDGDVDVVVGGGWLGLKLYENNGSGLELVPSWVCEPPTVPGGVRGLAWGDVDNDGYFELAVADTNDPPGSWFYVFNNNGGVLEKTPSWVINYYDFAINVAWGDIDADGDLDLACCTYHTGVYGDGFAYVFENNNGNLETSACWRSNEPKSRCYGLAWGDVNGDGELDLFKGIYGWGGEGWDKYSDIYYSENWFLNQDPSWESTGHFHDKVAFLADCDADGKLDLICTGGLARGYFTYSGELETYPSWRYRPDFPNILLDGLSMGDINGDGAFDIAFGCDDADPGAPEGRPNDVLYNTLNTGIVVNNFRATPKGENILLTWETNPSCAGFNLYRSVKSGGNGTRAITSRGRLNTETITGRSPYFYVDADVEPGTTYAYWLEAIDGAGVSERFGPVECTAGEKPAVLSLAQNAPNPAKRTTSIAFSLPERGPADIRVYDISGRVVAEIGKAEYDAGPNEIELIVDNLANGVYVYRLTAAGDTLVRKMVVAR